jgi:aminopeptidase YwaD
MFKDWITELKQEISGKQAYRYAARIAQYHRIQASPGYREAAKTVMELLKRDGVDAELVSYPARMATVF